MRLHRLAFAAVLAFTAPALAFDARDRTFEAGRVGAIIEGKTKPADLARIYGADNVRLGKVHDFEGEESPGAFIHRGTADALQLFFDQEGKRIETVTILGANWKSKSGLGLGTTLAELEQINGGPVKFYGFGFDYAGQVTESGPALAKFTLFLRPSADALEKALKQFLGEAQFSSRHPEVSSLGLRVGLIQVNFDRNPD